MSNPHLTRRHLLTHSKFAGHMRWLGLRVLDLVVVATAYAAFYGLCALVERNYR